MIFRPLHVFLSFLALVVFNSCASQQPRAALSSTASITASVEKLESVKVTNTLETKEAWYKKLSFSGIGFRTNEHTKKSVFGGILHW